MLDTKTRAVELARRGWDGDAISALLNITLSEVRRLLNNPRFPEFGAHYGTFDGRKWSRRGGHA